MKHSVFIPEPTAKERSDYTVGATLRKRRVPGDVGLEIECEGNKFEKNDDKLPKWWSYHQDGSLRGLDNAEYVLRRPIKFDEVETAVKDLWKVFNKYGTVLDDSNRTSVHVHLNMQDFHLNRLTAFLGMYFSVEELLTQWCGEHRVGNLFCLRGRDAPAIVSQVRKFIQLDMRYDLPTNLHYAGLNANALQKFGSLEVRTLRGCTEPEVILQWVKMLRSIYEKSGEYPDPRTVVDQFSGIGPLGFLNMVLGAEAANALITDLSWDNQRIMDSMYDGVHLAQDICYCRDWSIYNPVKVTEDPFGRVLKKSSLSALLEAHPSTVYQPSYNTVAPQIIQSPATTMDWEAFSMNSPTAMPVAPPPVAPAPQFHPIEEDEDEGFDPDMMPDYDEDDDDE